MKLNFLKFLIFFLGIFLFIIIYLTFIGIETEKFNQQIKDKVVQSKKELNIDLKKIKLTLDPLKLEINAKTIGAVFYYSNRPIELEYIKTKISLESFFKNKLVSSNFEIVTKSIFLKDLIKFARSITFRPELLILETIIENGHIILDINLNLDENGKIKKDYEVKGILKNGKIQFLQDLDFEKINFLFKLKEKNYLLQDIKFSTENIDFNSDILKIFKSDNIHKIEGQVENTKSKISQNLIRLLNLNIKNLDLRNTEFSSKSNFKLEVDNNFKFKKFKLESDINLDQILYKNTSLPSEYFPDLKKNILLNSHQLNLLYEKNNFLVNGKGNFKIGDNSDQIEYFIKKNKDNFEFETDINIKKTTLKNTKLFKTNFPLSKNLIDLRNHQINIKYLDNNLYLNGKGDIKIEKDFDQIKYSFLKNKDDIQITSEIDLKNISLKNKKITNEFFPRTKDLINLKKHKVKIKYNGNSVSFSGNGQIKINNDYDDIDYFILRKNNETIFDINANLNKTNFKIDNINYRKNDNFITKLNLSGSFLDSEKFILNNLSLFEKNNKIKITNLVLDQDFLLISLDEANFDYTDIEGKENQFKIKRTDNNYYKLNGLFFNANTIVTNLLEKEENKENKFSKNNIKIIFNLNEVYLDKINFINNLQGSVFLKKNKVADANISANFDSSNNIVFTINTKDNGQKITKLYSSKAKPLVKRYKFIKGFNEGSLDFISKKKDGKSVSNLKIYDFKLREMPILTKLLTLASLQGIADIFTGEGIRFDEFEMNFKTENNLITIDEIYAIGPAISILMDGYVEKDKLISLRGTLVPATTINKTVSKIPLLGKILVGDKTGEGIFGVSFKIKGPPKNLETTVNPIKTLTPRFITRTLEKLKKN